MNIDNFLWSKGIFKRPITINSDIDNRTHDLVKLLEEYATISMKHELELINNQVDKLKFKMLNPTEKQ